MSLFKYAFLLLPACIGHLHGMEGQSGSLFTLLSDHKHRVNGKICCFIADNLLAEKLAITRAEVLAKFRPASTGGKSRAAILPLEVLNKIYLSIWATRTSIILRMPTHQRDTEALTKFGVRLNAITTYR